MATYADLTALRAAYEGTIPVDAEIRAQDRLDSTERRLLRMVGGAAAVAVRIAAGTLTAADVKDVLVEATLRRWRNPSGYTSESAGDYSYSLGGGARAAAAGAWFTDAELAGLRSGTGAPRTIRVTTPYDGATGYACDAATDAVRLL